MAIVTNNPLIEGMHGMFGNLVFRTYGGRTIVSSRPRSGTKRTQSASQRATRSRFQEATRFAKICMRDPVKRASYQEKAKAMNLPNAYTAAITEYMRGNVDTVPMVTNVKRVTTYRLPADGVVEQKTAPVSWNTLDVALFSQQPSVLQSHNNAGNSDACQSNTFPLGLTGCSFKT